MASDAKSVSGSRLSELLKEHQEPFMLDIYLIEHGYTLNRWSFDKAESKCWSLHKPGRSLSLKKRKRSDSATVSRIIRHVLNKFRFPGKIHKDDYSERKDHKDAKGRFETSEYDGYSSSGARTIFESFFSSDSYEPFSTKYCSASSSSESVNAWNNSSVNEEVMGDGKQLRPASVLEIPRSENSSSYNYGELQNQQNKNLKVQNKDAEESLFFWSMWDTLMRTIEEKHGFGDSELRAIFGHDSSPQFVKTKLVLHQTGQLLFDYVREVVEIQTRKGRTTYSSSLQPCIFQQFLGHEQLARFICEQICAWRKTADDITNTTKLLQADLWRESNEWTHFRPEREIVCEVESAILAEIIHEIITDLLGI